jgi:hypothetical protein
MADPSPMAIDLEGASGQAARPDVLVEDEVPPVQPPEWNVAFVDRGCQQVVVATPDGLEPLDGVVGGADEVVDDGIGHPGEDRLDVAVVLGPQLPVDESIELAMLVLFRILLGLHAPNDGRSC